MEESFIEFSGSLPCRCCLAVSDGEYFDIFDNKVKEFDLYVILNILAPLMIEVDDGLSHVICEVCRKKAIESYSFRQTALDSDMVLRGIECVADDESQEPDPSNEYDITEMNQQEIAEESQDEEELAYQEEDNETSSEMLCGSQLSDEATLTNVEQENLMQTHHQMIQKVSVKSSRKYQCTICLKLFESPSKVQRHLSVHRDVLDPSDIPKRPQKEFKHECEVCGKRVETPSKLVRHMRVHDRNSKSYQGINQHRLFPCTDCGQRFWNEVKLQRHQIVHSETFEKSKIEHPEDFKFTCVLCLEKCPTYNECIDHMKRHREDIEDSEITCRLCSKSYPKLVNLIRHSKSHEENATHQCIHCGKRMGLGDDFIDHLLRHEGFRPFTCEYQSCGKSFIQMHKLKQHQQTHEDQKPKLFNCSECDKSFADKDHLKRHVLRHTGPKTHVCNVCPAKFNFKSALNAHQATHVSHSFSDEKRFACEVCPAKFSKPQSLKSHKKIHDAEKKFGCDLCDMKFLSNGHLKRHMLSHTGLKPYQCSHCNKAYGQSNDLVKHLRKHLGPNIYKCEIGDCQETFPKYGELKMHKTVHFVSVDMVQTSEPVYEKIKFL